MASKDWAILLSSEHDTLPLDPAQLNGLGALVHVVPDLEQGVAGFVPLLATSDVDWLLVGVDQLTVEQEEVLGAQIGLHRVRTLPLAELCFRVHDDAAQANHKAVRMIRAAMAAAEAGELPREISSPFAPRNPEVSPSTTRVSLPNPFSASASARAFGDSA